jgi:rhodanese-related sulfurtransferase
MERRYQGDVTPEEAWKTLAGEPGALLVDVRTTAEWTYVGLPDLSAIGVPFIRVEWQTFPGGQVNAEFVGTLDDALKAEGADRDTPIFFMCRSGVRSAAAAAAMTAAGYSRCYNVAGGFEGKPDDKRHRGRVNGWKAADLPWVQS